MSISDQSSTVGAHDATTHFAELLGRVEAGEELTITRDGTPVARLVPVKRKTTPAERRAATLLMREQAKKNKLRGLKIKDLINEGRP